MAATAISFNGVDLQTYNGVSGILTQEIDDSKPFERDLKLFNLVRTGGAVITDSTYYTKSIVVSGKIAGTSNSNLETVLDTLNQTLAVQDKNLDIGFAGSTRRYVCTPRGVSIDRPTRGSLWAAFQVEFLVTEYGKDTSTTTLVSASADTTASRTISLNGGTFAAIGGSAPEQFLRIQVTVTAATGLDGKTVTVQNATTGQTITVNRTWLVGDVLEINAATHTVKVNGVAVEFSGAFPYFAPGSHNVVIGNDFTTRTLTTTIDYTKRYL